MFDMRADPVLKEPDWRVVAQRSVATTAVVEHFNVPEQIGLCVGLRLVRAVEDAPGGRVVLAVALVAHQGCHAVLGQPDCHRLAGVLAATVAVEDDTLAGFAPELGHRQRVGDDVDRHPRFDRPAHDLAVEQFQHDGQVQTILSGLDVGVVACPHAVGRFRPNTVQLLITGVRLMHLLQHGAAVTHVVVAHFALDASGIETASAAHGLAAGDLNEQRITSACQALRGEWPQLAASCV